jgi:hypothetical protein
MENLDGLLFGSLVLAVAVVTVRASLFKIRNWRDWPARWREATPAVRWVLLSEMFPRAFGRDPLIPRSRAQAVLWEAPALFISTVLIVGAFFLIIAGPADM